MENKLALLKAYPAFNGLEDVEWLCELDEVQIIQASANNILHDGVTTCNNFFLLADGSVRVYQLSGDGREMTLYRLTAGDICLLSLASLLHQRPFNAVAESETNITALAIQADDFFNILSRSERFRKIVLSRLTDRCCDMMNTVRETAFNRLDMRLACILGRLFERNGSDTLYITHQALADELGTTREVVSRALKGFEREDCITLSRGKITLRSAKALALFSNSR